MNKDLFKTFTNYSKYIPYGLDNDKINRRIEIISSYLKDKYMSTIFASYNYDKNIQKNDAYIIYSKNNLIKKIDNIFYLFLFYHGILMIDYSK